jgi:hypothetical protein
MRHPAIFIAILLLFSNNAFAEPLLPKGWRVPTKEETKYDLPIREEDPYRYLRVIADFDGDKITDEARILVNDSKNKMGIFVFLRRNNNYKTIRLVEYDNKTWAEVIGISIVKPGKYKTACGKGYFDCHEGEPDVLVLKRPGINVFKFESANSFFYWDDSSESFKSIDISD